LVDSLHTQSLQAPHRSRVSSPRCF